MFISSLWYHFPYSLCSMRSERIFFYSTARRTFFFQGPKCVFLFPKIVPRPSPSTDSLLLARGQDEPGRLHVREVHRRRQDRRCHLHERPAGSAQGGEPKPQREGSNTPPLQSPLQIVCCELSFVVSLYLWDVRYSTVVLIFSHWQFLYYDKILAIQFSLHLCLLWHAMNPPRSLVRPEYLKQEDLWSGSHDITTFLTWSYSAAGTRARNITEMS